jgi:hypothetical protein
MSMKRIILLFISLIIPENLGCEGTIEPENCTYRRQLTIESNLSKIRIDNTYPDSITTYSYILADVEDSGNGTIVFYIYPVQDTGFIKLKLYGGELLGNATPSISFKDSLTIYTPIDTTEFDILKYQIVM